MDFLFLGVSESIRRDLTYAFQIDSEARRDWPISLQREANSWRIAA